MSQKNNLRKTFVFLYFLFISFFLQLLFSCGDKKETIEIQILDSYVDSAFIGMAQYMVYTSDTNWNEIQNFSDSLSQLYGGKTFDVIIFFYPKETDVRFKKNTPFAITTSGPNFEIARYYDTSHVYPPVLERYPDNYKKAKDYEKHKSK